ncbi:MAG TPA: TetR/AcrR family transcriptional regulator [Myxococcota bacterium]|nr:TetR/AcrR family transcriptional regulator [Myxococcota bacterium]
MAVAPPHSPRRNGRAGGARRTQADRSAATRAALADAAIDLLIERGWAAVSAIEVCNRVGVTRGAFHHHYPDLPGLLADALRRLYANMGRKQSAPVSDLLGLIDATWAALGNPRFKAVLEAWLAMSNDPSLRAEIAPVVAEFATLVRPDAKRALLPDDEHRDFYLMARETMLGLALGRATNGGRPVAHERTVLARLRADAARFRR